MLTLYIVSAAVAGVLIVLSLVGADHGAEHEIHVEHGDHDTGAHGYWMPFFSLRFYTYFFAAFGAVGLLGTFFSSAPAMVTLWLALAVGLVSGFSISILLRTLRKNESTSTTTEKDILGSEASVLVPIRGSSPGRIRCIVKGEAIDFLAVCDDPDPIAIGAPVIVVAIEDGRALVMPRSALYSDDSVSIRTT